MTQTILLVDSNAKRAAELETYLAGQLGFRVLTLQSGQEVIHYLRAGRIPAPDLVLYDLGFDRDALQHVHTIRQMQRSLPVIALVTQVGVELGVEAVLAGATDLLACPFHAGQLGVTIRKALLLRDLEDEVWRLRAWNEGAFSLGDIHAESEAMRATVFLAQSVANARFPLLLEGAGGVGKEMFARAIHGSSQHKNYPFISLNFSLLSPDEMEDALFGGLMADGAIARVGGGSIFIRGIEQMPDSLRRRLEIQILADTKATEETTRNDSPLRCRYMFAAYDAIRRVAGRERKEVLEFFSSIHALPIAIPSLRDMKDDIPMLADMLSRRYAVIEGRPILGITPAAGELLKEYSWGGNIRQLAQAVFHAVMCCDGSALDVADFRYLRNPDASPVSFLPDRGDAVQRARGKRSQDGGLLSCVDEAGNVRRLEEVEMEIIRYALSRYNGHMSDVARHLGIGRSTLYRKLADSDEA